jgi:hypothetical protein
MSTTKPSDYRNLLVALPILTLWFALIFAGNVVGLFQAGPGEPPLNLFLAILVPPGLFAVAYRSLSGFRAFVLSLDLRLITMFQSWRVVGASFLYLYAFSVVPAIFAFPAGWGDIAIGVTAPFYAFALISGKGFSKRAFATWNVLGIFDLAVAATLGALAAPGPQGILAGEITTEAVSMLPLSLIPTFLMPLFTILHIAALIKVAKIPIPGKQQLSQQSVPQVA